MEYVDLENCLMQRMGLWVILKIKLMKMMKKFKNELRVVYNSFYRFIRLQ